MKHLRPRPFLIGFSLSALILGIGFFTFVSTSCGCNLSQITLARLFTQETIAAPLAAFRVHNHRYPTTAEGLVALVQAPHGLEATWHGPYIDSDYRRLLDPWGRPYRYHYPGVHNPASYDVWSLGPDGKVSPDDIGNWDITKS